LSRADPFGERTTHFRWLTHGHVLDTLRSQRCEREHPDRPRAGDERALPGMDTALRDSVKGDR